MAKISNIAHTTNITFEFDFVHTENFDYVKERENHLNWVPFVLLLRIGDQEEYGYLKESKACLNLYEIQQFFDGINILLSKINKRCNHYTSLNDFEKYSFYALECYFNFSITDAGDNMMIFEIWLNMGEMTGGKITGYEKGIRFNVKRNDLENFLFELKSQLQSLLDDNPCRNIKIVT